MDLKLIELVFKFGNVFALTPSSIADRKPTNFQHFHTFLVVALYLVAYCATVYNTWPIFRMLTGTQFVLAVLSSVAACTHDLYTILTLRVYQRDQLFKLVDNLKLVSRIGNATKSYYVIFLVSQVAVFLFGTFGIYIHLGFFNFTSFILKVFSTVQLYFEVFVGVFRCILLDMVLSRYQHQNRALLVLTSRKQLPKNLSQDVKRIKYNFYVLNYTVDSFNKTFGVPVLSNIFCGVCSALITLDIFIKSDGTFSYGNTTINLLNFIYQMGSWITLCVRETRCLIMS
jgi:hypothetical protein